MRFRNSRWRSDVRAIPERFNVSTYLGDSVAINRNITNPSPGYHRSGHTHRATLYPAYASQSFRMFRALGDVGLAHIC